MGEFRMPSLGADMESGTLAEWRVTPGQAVHRGDIVAVVETDKAAIEVEVFEDGTVGELVAAVGDEVPVGGVMAHLTPANGAGAAPRAPTAPAAHAPDTHAPSTPEPGGEPGTHEPGTRAPDANAPDANAPDARAPDARAPGTHSPVVRHLAERLAVDLATVHGTGPDGSVTRADVEQAGRTRVRATPYARRLAAARGVDLTSLAGGASAPVVAAQVPAGPPVGSAPPQPAPPQPAPTSQTPPPPRTGDPSARRRAAVAALMARSKREIPHFYLSSTIDMAPALEWLVAHNEQRSVHERVLPAALLLHAVVHAAQEVPAVNGHWIDGAFRPSAAVHLGVAVHLRDGGLVAPTITDAQTLGLDALMARLRALVAGARRGTLRASEMGTPTITVTNIGEQGVEQLFGVIYPPQVAMVGFGAIVARPWAVGDMLTVHPTVTATLAADHRASDGHEGARFLGAVAARLQELQEDRKT